MNPELQQFAQFAKQGVDYINKLSSNIGEIRCDAIKNNDKIIMLFDVPGVEKDGFDINIVDDMLTMKYKRERKASNNFSYFLREREFGNFHKSIRIPHPIKENKIETSLNNGVLKIILIRAESKKTRVNI